MHASIYQPIHLFIHPCIYQLMYPTSLAFFKFNFLFSCVKPLFYRCSYFTFISQFCHSSFLFLGKPSSYIYLIFQRFPSPPTIIVTPSHQVAERPQDSIAYWLEEQSESSFKICFREKEIFAGLHQKIKMVSGLLNALNINVVPNI